MSERSSIDDSLEQEDIETWLEEDLDEDVEEEGLEILLEESLEEGFEAWLEENAEEDFEDWLEKNSFFEEDVDLEGLTDWVVPILSGAGKGAITGAAAGGGYGAIVGGVVGGAGGAVQAYQQQKGKPPAPAVVPATPPPAATTPSVAPVATPATGSVPQVSARPSAPPPQQLQQLLGELLPVLVPQLLAQLQQGVPPAKAAGSSGTRGEMSGDYLSDDVFSTHFEDRGIEEAVPTKVQVQGSEFASEYPDASRFVSAATGNYRMWEIGSSRPIRRIVLHITDGDSNIDDSISWFSNPSSRVSAHYLVGQDGEIVQMVRHNDVAFHTQGNNADTIGIEHVARAPGHFSVRDSGLPLTEAQYCSSAALVRWLCEQYGIPLDRAHIQGHSEVDPQTTHTACPNALWEWNYFMSLVTSGKCSPMYTS